MWETLRDWAFREIAEVKRAPAALVLVFCLGSAAGWWATSSFYAERFAVMDQRINSLQQAVQGKSSETPTVSPTITDSTDDFMIQSWGGGAPERCQATMSGKRMAQYVDRFAVVLVCGLSRSDIDRLTDPAITVSPPFTIQSAFVIGVPVSAAQMEAIAKIASNRPANIPSSTPVSLQVVTWYEVALIPKGLDTAAIHTLADIERVGGKRFPDQGRTIIAIIPPPKK